MIRLIAFKNAIQLPGQVGATTTWNRTTHGGISTVERTAVGIEITWGKKDDKGKYQPGNEVMLVPWANVTSVTEAKAEVKK